MPYFNVRERILQNRPIAEFRLDSVTPEALVEDNALFQASEQMQQILIYEQRNQRINEQQARKIRETMRDIEREHGESGPESGYDDTSAWRAREAAIKTRVALRAAAKGRDTTVDTSWGQWWGSTLENWHLAKQLIGLDGPDKRDWEEMIDLMYGGPVNPSAQASAELEAAGYPGPWYGNLAEQLTSWGMLTNTLPQTGLVMVPAVLAGGVAVLTAPASAPALAVAGISAGAAGVAGFGTETFFSLGEAFRHNAVMPDAFEEAGIDPFDRRAQAEAMKDPEMRLKVLGTAAKYGAATAAADAASFGILRLPRRAAAAAFRGTGAAANAARWTTRNAAQLAAQGAVEAAGDFGGQVFAYGYEKVQYDEVAMEAIVGGGMGVGMSAFDSIFPERGREERSVRPAREAPRTQPEPAAETPKGPVSFKDSDIPAGMSSEGFAQELELRREGNPHKSDEDVLKLTKTELASRAKREAAEQKEAQDIADSSGEREVQVPLTVGNVDNVLEDLDLSLYEPGSDPDEDAPGPTTQKSVARITAAAGRENVDAKIAARAVVDAKNAHDMTVDLVQESLAVPKFVETLSGMATSAKNAGMNATDFLVSLRSIMGNRGGIWVKAEVVIDQFSKGEKALLRATGQRRGAVEKRAEDGGFVLITLKTLAEEAMEHGKDSSVLKAIPANDSKFRVNHVSVNEARQHTKSIAASVEAKKTADSFERDKLDLVEHLTNSYIRNGLDPVTARAIATVNAELTAAVAAVSHPGLMKSKNWIELLNSGMPFVNAVGDKVVYNEWSAEAEIERVISFLLAGKHVRIVDPEAGEEAQAQQDQYQRMTSVADGPALRQDLDDIKRGGIDLLAIMKTAKWRRNLEKLTYREVWHALMVGRLKRAWNLASDQEKKNMETHWSQTYGILGPTVDYLAAAKDQDERDRRLSDLIHFYKQRLSGSTDPRTIHLASITADLREDGLSTDPVAHIRGLNIGTQRIDNTVPYDGGPTDASVMYNALFAMGNATTIIHEHAHYLMDALTRAFDHGSLDKGVAKALEKVMGVDLAWYVQTVSNMPNMLATDPDAQKVIDAQEKFAEGLEQYITQGRSSAPPALRKVFRAAARALANIYAKFRGAYITSGATQDSVKLFDLLLNASEAAKREVYGLYPEVTKGTGESREQTKQQQVAHELLVFERNHSEAFGHDEEVEAMTKIVTSELLTGEAPEDTASAAAWLDERTVRAAFDRDDWVMVVANRQLDELGSPTDQGDGEANTAANLASASITAEELVKTHGKENVTITEIRRGKHLVGRGFIVTGVEPGNALRDSGHGVGFTRRAGFVATGKVLLPVATILSSQMRRRITSITSRCLAAFVFLHRRNLGVPRASVLSLAKPCTARVRQRNWRRRQRSPADLSSVPSV